MVEQSSNRQKIKRRQHLQGLREATTKSKRGVAIVVSRGERADDKMEYDSDGSGNMDISDEGGTV